MTPLRVMMVHNAYREWGGEDGVVSAELALLRNRGHEVIELRRNNLETDAMSGTRLAVQTLWSGATHAQASELLRQHRPDVVHVHNTFALISPSLYWACAAQGVPVVQTLHNFRLACPQAMFLRDGKVCESCIGKTPWPALVHACYRGSRTQTAVMFAMLGMHQVMGTFEKKITRYIALTQFSRAKFIAAGLPADRLVVKPNFVVAPAPATSHSSEPSQRARNGLLHVGRLSPEKGTAVLAEAWRHCDQLSLRVAGVGSAAQALSALKGVSMLGQLSASEVRAEMGRACALVLPSIIFENFPLTLVEAYASGLPVIASRIGALAELVEDGVTGLLFNPGDAKDLADRMQWAASHPAEMALMGAHARTRYEQRYTPEINYLQLMAIYRSAIEEEQERAVHA